MMTNVSAKGRTGKESPAQAYTCTLRIRQPVICPQFPSLLIFRDLGISLL